MKIKTIRVEKIEILFLDDSEKVECQFNRNSIGTLIVIIKSVNKTNFFNP